MAKKYNVRLIKSRRSYTMAEIAKLFNVHVRTVQSWHKGGLKPIDPDDRPFLFCGKDVREFLSNRRASKRIKLKDGEFYCPRCRKARQSIRKAIEIIDTKKSLGNDDTLVIIKGKCRDCSCRINRFFKKSTVKSSFFGRISKKGHNRLKGDSKAIVNADLFEEN